MLNTVSPSRTYVALAVKRGYSGYFFVKFELPNIEAYINDSNTALFYYMTQIDLKSVLEGCVSFEEYSNIKTAEQYICFAEKDKADAAIQAIHAVAAKHGGPSKRVEPFPDFHVASHNHEKATLDFTTWQKDHLVNMDFDYEKEEK